MRNFSGGASVELIGGDTLRLFLKSPTGETVYHDLTPAEAEAIREAIPAEVPVAAPVAAPAASIQPQTSRRAAKEK